MADRVKTTAEHFAWFKDECLKCAEKWKLDDIDLNFRHGKKDGYRATFHGRHVARVGTVTLSTEWDEFDDDNPAPEITEEAVRQSARHEMIHAILLPLACMTSQPRNCSEDEVIEAEERIVQKLVRLLP